MRIYPNNHDEWLNHRSQGIGSSEVGVLLGVNPYETKYQLWRRKMGIDPPKEETFAMKAGHYLEDGVACMFRDETGYNILEDSKGDFIIADDEFPHRRVSPDRIYLINPKGGDDISNMGILECKTTQMDVDFEDVPKYWEAQLQYQMGVSGIKKGAIAWLCSGRYFGYREYDFDPALFKLIASAVDDFWHTNVLGAQEPEQVTKEDIILRWDKSELGKILEADDDILHIIKNLKECKALEKELQEQIEKFETAVKIFMKDAESLCLHGKPLVTYKSVKQRVIFDSERFKGDHGDMYSAYCKGSKPSRMLLVK